MCYHDICLNITRKLGHLPKGVGAVLWNDHITFGKVVYLGLEKGGRYRDQYNICAGGASHSDHGCILETLKRELYEEFGIRSDLDKIFRYKGHYEVFFVKKTPIFVGKLYGYSRIDINNKIVSNRYKGSSFREIECIQAFHYPSLVPVDNNYAIKPISSFATSAMMQAAVFIH